MDTQRSGTSHSRSTGHRDSPLQGLLFHLKWLHTSLPGLSLGYPFRSGPGKQSNNSNNFNNANNSNRTLLLSISTVNVHEPKNVVHKIQELLDEKIVFLQQALHGMLRITAASQRKISLVTLHTNKILTRPL